MNYDNRNIFQENMLADKIGLNFGVLLTTVLCTLGLPYRIPSVVPSRQILSNSFSGRFFS